MFMKALLRKRVELFGLSTVVFFVVKMVTKTIAGDFVVSKKMFGVNR